jgi:hypothetical protein
MCRETTSFVSGGIRMPCHGTVFGFQFEFEF